MKNLNLILHAQIIFMEALTSINFELQVSLFKIFLRNFQISELYSDLRDTYSSITNQETIATYDCLC